MPVSGQKLNSTVNAITGLPEMQWRALDPVPYSMANLKGGWDLVPIEYPYVDGYGHNNMGSKSKSMPFKLFFVNTVQPNIFPEVFDKWFKAIAVDGTAGTLMHPLLGEIDARVTEWDVELVAERTAGVVMNVTWTDTVLDPDAALKFKGVEADVTALAKTIDEQMHDLEIAWPDGARTTSLSDTIGQINGLIFSTRLRIEGMVNQALGIVNSIIETVDNANEHKNWALSFNLKQFYDGLTELGTAATRLQFRPTAVMMTMRRMTLDEIAIEKDNSLGEIIGLNPALVALPYVPANQPVNYFTD